MEEEKVAEGLENEEDLPNIDEKNFRYPGPTSWKALGLLPDSTKQIALNKTAAVIAATETLMVAPSL
jgi:hypothetical protein